jgi:hypothetical protein
MGLLIPEVFILLLTDSITMLLLIYASPYAFQIASKWDMASSANQQYRLEKRRYLLSTIVFYVFLFKIPLFLFYVYTNDKLAAVLTGAMCAAGSINATVYGSKLLYMKILNIFLMSGWLAVYKGNNTFEDLPYTRIKYAFLLFIVLTVTTETALSFLNFANIDPTAVVSCCSSIYSTGGDDVSLLMSIKPFTAFYTFIGCSLLLITAILLKNATLTAILSGAFFFTGVANLILFTGTYVYELPSHKCPYCILQKEYMYVGYAFYISLFLAAANGINTLIYKIVLKSTPVRSFRISLIFVLIFLLISLFFPLRYYAINSVWL